MHSSLEVTRAVLINYHVRLIDSAQTFLRRVTPVRFKRYDLNKLSNDSLRSTFNKDKNKRTICVVGLQCNNAE